MNIKKTQLLIRKINTLHSHFIEDEGHFSKIERDLFLEYIRKLYSEVYFEFSPDIETENEIKPGRSLENSIQREIKPAVAVIPETRVAARTPAVLLETEKVHRPNGQPINVVNEVETEPKINPAISKLFEDAVLKKSDRFASLPIQDLRKAMGINDKILTINELFQGNQSLFNSTIEKLQGLATFDLAKQYLIQNVIDDMGWLSDNKRNRAIAFLQLIRRKFL